MRRIRPPGRRAKHRVTRVRRPFLFDRPLPDPQLVEYASSCARCSDARPVGGAGVKVASERLTYWRKLCATIQASDVNTSALSYLAAIVRYPSACRRGANNRIQEGGQPAKYRELSVSDLR